MEVLHRDVLTAHNNDGLFDGHNNSPPSSYETVQQSKQYVSKRTTQVFVGVILLLLKLFIGPISRFPIIHVRERLWVLVLSRTVSRHFLFFVLSDRLSM